MLNYIKFLELRSGEFFRPVRNVPVDFDMMDIQDMELSEELLDLIKTAYKGFNLVRSTYELQAKNAKGTGVDLHGSPDFDFVSFYKNTAYGKKHFAVGHDGSKQAKIHYIVNKVSELKKPGNYAEVSDTPEKILRAAEVPFVTEEETVRKVLDKPLKWIGEIDGVDGWYERNISGVSVKKRMAGTPLV